MSCTSHLSVITLLCNPLAVLSKKGVFIHFPEKETKASGGEVTYIKSPNGPTAEELGRALPLRFPFAQAYV